MMSFFFFFTLLSDSAQKKKKKRKDDDTNMEVDANDDDLVDKVNDDLEKDRDMWVYSCGQHRRLIRFRI